MKYYSLKFKRDLDGWGGKAKMWKIQILEKYRSDTGLLEHEKFHVRQWYYAMFTTFAIAGALGAFMQPGWGLIAILGPFVHSRLSSNKYYRKWSEIRAYRIQLKTGNYHSPEFAVNALMAKYGLGMSEKKARKALGLS